MNTIRCFVGVPLSEDIAQGLLGACAVLREADPAWRDEKWVRAENLHLTMKFLGDIDEEDLDPLCARMGAALSECVSFELPFSGLHPAGGLRHCRMLWGAFTDPDGRCEALHAAVEQAATAFGVEADARSFTPHATLCRARRPKRLSTEALSAAEAALQQAPDSMSVVSASVFTSRLTPRGPIYREIGAWRLRGE